MASLSPAALTLLQLESGALRVSFAIGAGRPSSLAEDETSTDEALMLSVLIEIPANPRLLDVQKAALERVQRLVKEELRAIDDALDEIEN